MNILGNSDDQAKALAQKMASIKAGSVEDEAKKVAAAAGVPYISLKGFPVAQEALGVIPEEQAREGKIVCFLLQADEIRVASPEPTSEKVKEIAHQIGERNHASIKIYAISVAGFEEAIAMYARIPKVKEIEGGVEISEADITKYESILGNFPALQEKIPTATTTDIVVMIIGAALMGKTSDIHVEAEEKQGVVRLRIDGMLHEVLTIPRELMPRVASRFKLVAGLKINVDSIPQDGRFTITMKGEKIEVRVSTLPTAFGESIVMRLLRPGVIALDFEALGIMGRAAKQLKEQVARHNGMILTTGPTGSGKTTTLYAILQSLNKEDTKIITLEDPVEYKLKGIAQSQIDATKDFTFAKGLRSILRQDPDVVMVGEIRDLETAEVAIQAALTGHIMLSTIHTNSASGAIPRFLSMGVKPFLLAPALNAIIGQRLIRRLCECKIPETDETKIQRAKDLLSKMPTDHGYETKLDAPQFFAAKGCEKCMSLGYKGRLGIYEVMGMNKDVEGAINSPSVSEFLMEEIAIKNGMVTKVQDGVVKATLGLTSLDEVFAAAE